MDTSGFGLDSIFKIILTFLTVSGGAAWTASFLTNKRGTNKALDFLHEDLQNDYKQELNQLDFN